MFIRIVLAALLAAFSIAAFAYPEGYPRVGEPFVLADDGIEQIGSFRKAAKDLPGADNDEYLFAWLTSTGIRAVTVDGNTLEQKGEPFQLVTVTSSDPLPIPGRSGEFVEVTDFDIEWNPQENRYFLVMKLLAEELIISNTSSRWYLMGTYLDSDLTTTPSNWTEISDVHGGHNITSPRGVRSIHGPANGQMHVFWHNGYPDNLSDPSGTIYGRLVSDVQSNGRLVFGGGRNLLMKVADKTTLNDFYLADMAIELDRDNEQFLLAATLGSASPFQEGNKSILESRIYARVVLPGPGLPAGETADSYIQLFNEVGEFRKENDYALSESWTAFHPKVVLGPPRNSGNQREWLIAFKAAHGINNGKVTPDMHTSWFARRASVSSTHALTPLDNQDRLVGGTESNGEPKRNDPALYYQGHGLWVHELGRYLFPWSTTRTGQGLLDTVDDRADSASGRVTGEAMVGITSNLDAGSGPESHHFGIHVVPAINTNDGRYFLVGQHRDHLQVQPIELRWLDYSISVREVDEAGEPLPFGETRRVEITLECKNVEGVDEAIDDFDAGIVTIRVDGPRELGLASDDFTSGDAESGYLIEAENLAVAERRTYEIEARNENPDATERETQLVFVSIPASDRTDHVPSNDSESLTLVLRAQPDGTDPGDGDGGDPDQDDPDKDDPDNTDPNDDPDNEDPDNGDPDNSNPDNGNPDNNDPDNGDSDTKKGGGATGLLLLFGLGITGWRRRRNK